MGSSESRCSVLLEKMGWPAPQYAGEFHNGALTEYLESQNLEVILPRHAPQCDISMGDKKPAMYPRPNFCWEAYKMHAAMIGPSSACKKQIREFLPKVADVFTGPSSRLGPGREAVPYNFLDEQLHRLVLWELPELNFKQKCEDYIREIGLLYVDCVFMLFSDKYVLTEIYSKLCVAMAIHGIPFFVICTMSGDELDEKSWQRLKSDFQKKDIQVRMFNPKKPEEFMEALISDFFKEVSWNRSNRDDVITKGISENVLGQTVRLKNIEKKPELNGRCGVCIGYDKDASRYRVRLITGGVETDLALKEDCVSILKPKLLNAMVQIKGLESKPELNGRYGFVDEFLRENERYRVFLPDMPGKALALALKAQNLERVTSFAGAQPVSASAPLPAAKQKPPQGQSQSQRPGPAAGAASQQAPKAAAAPASASAASSREFDPPAREKPVTREAPAPKATSSASSPVNWRGPTAPSVSASVQPPSQSQARPSAQPRRPPAAAEEAADDDDDDDLAHLLPKRDLREDAAPDLMSRIFAGGSDDEAEEHTSRAGANGKQPPQQSRQQQPPPPRRPPPAPARRLSRAGLLSMRVWAVVGDVDEAEELVDHLMDCGRTVYTISPGGGALYRSMADIVKDTRKPKPEVLTFFHCDDASMEAAVREAASLGLHGVILHSSAGEEEEAAGRAAADRARARCREEDVAVHEADIFTDIALGTGIAVAPLDNL